MKTFFLFLLLILPASTQDKQPEWSFPRAGMETKKIADETVFRLEGQFYGIRTDYQGLQGAKVFLPSTIDAAIELLNKQQPGAITDRDQFIVAVAVEKAVITAKGTTNKHVGKGEFNGKILHFFKTKNSATVAGYISQDRTFVGLMTAPDPTRRGRPE